MTMISTFSIIVSIAHIIQLILHSNVKNSHHLFQLTEAINDGLRVEEVR